MFAMLGSVSRAIWLAVAPTNALIMVTAAAGVWAVLGLSKYGALLAVAGVGGLIIGAFSPVSDWLTAPLEHRFPQWKAGSQQPTVDGIIVLGGEAGARVATLVELSRQVEAYPTAYSTRGNLGSKALAQLDAAMKE